MFLVGGHGFSKRQDIQKDHNSRLRRDVDQLDTVMTAFLFSCCIPICCLYCPTSSIPIDQGSLIDAK